MIITQGGRFAGWGLVILDGKPVWVYKRSQVPGAGIRIEGPDKVSPGPHTLAVAFDYDGKAGEVGAGGTFTLTVDGVAVGRASIERTVPYIYSVDETLDVGEDKKPQLRQDQSIALHDGLALDEFNETLPESHSARRHLAPLLVAGMADRRRRSGGRRRPCIGLNARNKLSKASKNYLIVAGAF